MMLRASLRSGASSYAFATMCAAAKKGRACDLRPQTPDAGVVQIARALPKPSLPLWYVASFALSLATPALAQQSATAAYPAQQSVDENGVDILDGKYSWEAPKAKVGDNENGLEAGRTLRGSQYRESHAVNIDFHTITAPKVAFGGVTDEFKAVNGVFVPVESRGQSLVVSGGVYTYTSSDGAVVVFAAGSYHFGNAADISAATITYPNGKKLTFDYDTIATVEGHTGRRIKFVTSNTGYRLVYGYSTSYISSSAYASSWGSARSVSAINIAADPCTPTEYGCAETQALSKYPSIALDIDPEGSYVTGPGGAFYRPTFVTSGGAVGEIAGIKSPDYQGNPVGPSTP